MDTAEAARRMTGLFREIEAAGITVWTDPDHLEFDVSGRDAVIMEKNGSGEWERKQ
jgi:hypothetical protein